MKFLLLHVISVLPIAVKCATTVTLFGVHQSGECTLSVVGVGTDRLATLSVEWVESLEPIVTGFSTYLSDGKIVDSAMFGTATIPPVTIHETIVADASHYALTEEAIATDSNNHNTFQAISCDLDGKGGGSCIKKIWGGVLSDTLTASWTGSAIPFHTEVFSGGNGARGGFETIPVLYLVVCSVISLSAVFGFFIGL
ncbi:hypothetical protein BDZ94DRAFT_1263407 [Collybia nuda]|uniref:DOMON domain-containing protein n=1 Tax=Collybia nuda TaxID=64659 RepID=A0A9P5Y3G6_9AGAR|nr:hypothetical protein BDZ94DRAFT_1263407 [Collybia nuda]